MRLYFNDALVHCKPEEGDVLAAFEHLRAAGEARLELRRGESWSFRVSREGGPGFSVALRQPDGVIGLRIPEPFAERVAGALCDFLWAGA